MELLYILYKKNVISAERSYDRAELARALGVKNKKRVRALYFYFFSMSSFALFIW